MESAGATLCLGISARLDLGPTVPLVCNPGLAFSPWGWVTRFIFRLQVFSQTLRNSGALAGDRLTFFQLWLLFQAWGGMKFMVDHLTAGRQLLSSTNDAADAYCIFDQ